MSVLIDSQSKLKRFYDEAAEKTNQLKLKSHLLETSNIVLKQTDMMRRARMQSVVEIALEPIDGLKLNDVLERLLVAERNEADHLDKVAVYEKALSQLYARCSSLIEQMSADTSRLLLELSQECVERANWLSQPEPK
jgi:predicted transcriptional regulator